MAAVVQSSVPESASQEQLAFAFAIETQHCVTPTNTDEPTQKFFDRMLSEVVEAMRPAYQRTILMATARDLRKKADAWYRALANIQIDGSVSGAECDPDPQWHELIACAREIREALSQAGYAEFVWPNKRRVAAPMLVELVSQQLAPAAKSAKTPADPVETIRRVARSHVFDVNDADTNEITLALRKDGPSRAATVFVGKMIGCSPRRVAELAASAAGDLIDPDDAKKTRSAAPKRRSRSR